LHTRDDCLERAGGGAERTGCRLCGAFRPNGRASNELLFLDVNEAFSNMTGYSHAELLGRSTAEIELWESSSARPRQDFQKAGTIRNYEIRLRTKAGDLLDCLVSAERVTILGKPCALNVVQDITERKRSESELFTAIEAVMQDTSWFSQKVIEKVADLRQPRGSNVKAAASEDLTEREREVLGLMCTGAVDAGIAQQLGVSRHTVRNHVSAIYEKIGVHRRSAAIVWARDRGLNGRTKPPGAKTKRRPKA
jgi:PAS domain S-box-containing protein